MKLKKCLKRALGMVIHSKLRSWLTIIGIVIGVGAVIAIMSIGAGMQESLNAQMSGLGGDILTLSPGFSKGGGGMFGRGGFGGGDRGGGQATEKAVVLSRTDLQALKSVPDIALIEAEIRGSSNVTYLGKSGSVSVTGVDQKVWAKITSSKIKNGRFLDSADQNVVVIGGGLASSYFDRPVGINKMLNIGGNAFRVVGITDDTNKAIYMPIETAFKMIQNKQEGDYDSITIKIKNEAQLDAVMAKITKSLMIVRHVTDKTQDFTLTSSKQMMQTRADMMASMNAFLLAIAAVSLIVGSVGIANTMFTSVLEKTKEIGIMKAIGAKNKDILMIFLLNAALIGLIGGVIGVLVGVLLSGSLPALMGTSLPLTGRGGVTTLVSLNSVILALSVSVIVGIVAGMVPALKASKLKPVDALRYE